MVILFKEETIMNITSPMLRQLAYSVIDSVEALKTLEVLDKSDKLYRVSYSQSGSIEVCIGHSVRKLDCNTDFKCVCRTITIDSAHFYDIKCVTVYVNKNNDMDNVITITTSEYVKGLYKEDIEKIVENLKSIESSDENTMLDRFSVEYKKNIIVLDDQKKSLTYRLDHIIQTILDLK